ncbi:hypothetical protein VNO77_35533 [Canavalia gladiata]|uniref:Alkane hydroxylase MAH1-like n=1 Tax=Canavalia gladiata TaxID=3824 RepID=A0AAN9PXT0_CANGL
MAILMYLAILITTLFCFLYHFYRRQCCKHPLFIDHPIIGMFSPLLRNLHRVHDLSVEVLQPKGGTGEFSGPWFTNMNYLVTIDPINIHHILTKSFHNYVKGNEFREIFQAFGESTFTSDSEEWKYNRSLFHSLFKKISLEMFLEKTVHNKVHNGVFAILEHVHQQRTVVDLQDVFNRFTFDNICSLVLGYDPNSLSIHFPNVAIEKAFSEVEESIFYRHLMPKTLWKLQKWFQVGEEKKMTQACETFDEFLYAYIASKRQKLSKYNDNQMVDTHQVDLLTALMREENAKTHDDKFLRDSVLQLFIAGRDTITSALTWFFWLVATNPLVEAKILEEIKHNFGGKEHKVGVLSVEALKKMVYLHGAICEALRLYPPVPFELKQAIDADKLPSGHSVNPNTKILFSFYAMGRSEEIWGKDCLEFKPERWISERGGIVYVPSYKFIAFNSGPRTCLGKDLSFIQLKMVATAILQNYCVHVVEGHVATPSLSIILLMKDGLKVRITRRED